MSFVPEQNDFIDVRPVLALEGLNQVHSLRNFVQTGRIKVVNEYVNVGQFAHGGRVRAGEPILVGERRPELFVPGTDGHINPMVGGSDALDLSEGTLMRLAAILARMSLSTTISAGSLDAAVGARL